MKRKTIFSIVLIMLLLLIIGGTKVEAASATLTASKTTAEVGDTVDITAKFTAAAWNLTVSGDGITTKKWASQTSDLSEKTTTEKISLNASKVGTYKISLSGDITDENGNTIDINKSLSVTVKEKEVVLSNVATLKTFGIKPNDFSGFKAGTTSYSVSVPKSVEKINIYGTATDSKATVSGLGDKKLNIGSNKFEVKVTAEDKKTTKTYTLNVTRKETSSDATLKSLGITPKEYDTFKFKVATTSYDVKVPTSLDKIKISAAATDSSATVEGVGEKQLKDGDNKFEIKVTAEDKKTTKTYVLNVKREEATTTDEQNQEEIVDNEPGTDEIIEQKDGLTNLLIDGYTLSPEFSQDVFSYEVGVYKDLTEDDIIVETSGDDIEVTKGLDENGELIIILVRNTKTNEVTTYQINVKKLEETVTEDKKTSASNKELIFIGIGILAAIILIVMIIKKIKARDEDDYEDEEDNVNVNNSLEYYKEQERLEEEAIERKPKKGKRFK